jgi:hypothetical protein
LLIAPPSWEIIRKTLRGGGSLLDPIHFQPVAPKTSFVHLQLPAIAREQ